MEDTFKILEEAKKCLNCKNPMCKKGCPIKSNIPEFINAIKEDNLEEAYNILQENNIMSDICSNVCPYEEYCAGNCIKGIKGEPIQVNKLENISEASLNFINKSLTVDHNGDNKEVFATIEKIVHKLEVDEIISLNKACELLGVTVDEYKNEDYNY